MTYDFDEEVARTGTSCVKWEFLLDGEQLKYGDHAHPKYGADRLLPLWVADMDFRCPPAVIEALVTRAEQGVYGYSSPTDSYFQAVLNWFSRRYGRTIERDWIILTPGVVPALNVLVQTFVEPGQKVLVQPPVYHPFFHAIENNDRQIETNPLVYQNGSYTMDFDDLAQKAADPAVQMAILCSPHNPIGRVWTPDELTRFGEICHENNVLVVSDEIHCDLIFDGFSFTSFAALGETFEQKSIICTAASKTFNLAGLKISNIIIPDQDLRDQFTETMMRHGMYGASAFGLDALEAAYNHGQAWLEAVMEYVQGNYLFMEAYLAQHLPQIRIVPPEGTYMVWVDFSALELDPAARNDLLLNKARVFLSEGRQFGSGGQDFERFNLACPRSILAEALDRIKTAIDTLPD